LTDPKKNLELTRLFLTRHQFNHLLGLELVRAHRDGITIRCKVRDELMNSAGTLHGGVTASVADAAVGGALLYHCGRERRFTTVELKVNYFRPVTEGVLVARSRLLRIGSTIAVGQVDLTDGQRRSAGVAIATYMFVDAPKA
jgi:acyl-CoA thioesterase